MGGKRRFTQQLLDSIICNSNAVLVGKYPHLTRDSEITYICKCGNLREDRNFKQMELNGAVCWDCSKKQAKLKLEQTSMERYQVPHPRQSPIVENRRKETCMQIYGVDNPLKDEAIQTQIKQTMNEIYGVDNAFQSKELMEQAKLTSMVKYGVKYPSQSEDIKEKMKQTNQERRGVDYPGQCPIVKEKMKNTNLERSGVENPFQAADFTEKSEAACMEKYGVRHSSQDEEIRLKTLKSAFQQKEFVMPSGRTVKVQGYEPYALRDLLKTYSDEQIKVDSEGGMPEIFYTTEDGKTHRYYPDIFIPHENKIIEVKSPYTAGEGGRNVMLKQEATIRAGFIYEIWCYNAKGQRVEL